MNGIVSRYFDLYIYDIKMVIILKLKCVMFIFIMLFVDWLFVV